MWVEWKCKNKKEDNVKNKNSFINWISFLTALGSLAAGIGTLWALVYLKQQYTTSIQPDIVINNESAVLLIERYKTNGYIDFQIANDSIYKKQSGIVSNSFNLKLHNIGLGVAKDIKLTWSFDTLKIITILNNNKPIPFIDSIVYSHKKYIFYDKKDTNYYYEFGDVLNNRINYLLPSRDSKDIAKANLPYLYVRMYSFYQILNAYIQQTSHLEKEVIGEFPDLYLNISYLDISNNKYKKWYRIIIKTGSGSEENLKLYMWDKVIL